MRPWRKKVFLSLIIYAFLGKMGALWGHEPRIVGSASVFPFSAVVVQNLSLLHHEPVPIVEKTGSGAGIKLFCGGHSSEFPVGVNSSRPMSSKERRLCKEHEAGKFLEIKLGYGGIILAVVPHGEKGETGFTSLSLKDIYDALSKDIYKDGKWIPNPYKRWCDINPSLPDREILVFGPPATSGMREALKDIIFAPHCKDAKGVICGQFREDGLYIEMPENTKLIIQKLHTNPQGIGILGYPFLAENPGTLSAIKINYTAPTLKTIMSGAYPLSRPLYFYIKASALSTNEVVGHYVASLMSEEMWSEEGLLSEKGLIVPSLKMRDDYRRRIEPHLLAS